ncbi:MAG: hypothetical protein H7836_16310 [Magnetococcus sp. YQC-3]
MASTGCSRLDVGGEAELNWSPTFLDRMVFSVLHRLVLSGRLFDGGFTAFGTRSPCVCRLVMGH